jgi:hypothetical protein
MMRNVRVIINHHQAYIESFLGAPTTDDYGRWPIVDTHCEGDNKESFKSRTSQPRNGHMGEGRGQRRRKSEKR